MTIKEAILRLAQKEDIGYEGAKQVMNEIMSGEASDVQKAAYLTAFAMKGETIDEITGSAQGMIEHAVKFPSDKEALEIVGTGGDRSNSFNISTTSAFVISAAGVPVAKHGNRAASSKSGAADCLEALGVNITCEPEVSAKALEETNMCFLFAQKYHTSMKYVGPIRKELAIRTVFNIIGPLSNPANIKYHVMGVYTPELLKPMAEVLVKMGVKHVLVVYGNDCLDEVSASSETSVCEYIDGEYKSYTIKPEDFGLERCSKADTVGGSPEDNAKIALAILGGEKGPHRTAVVLNAGVGLYAAGKVASIEEGVRLAEETIDSGKAKEQVDRVVKATNA